MDKTYLQALTAGSISFLVWIFVYRLARTEKLSFRYAVGWMSLSAIGVGGGLASPAIEPVAKFLGITSSALIGLLAVLLLVTLSIQLSVSISGIQGQNRRLAESVALLQSEELRGKGSRTIDLNPNLDDGNILVVVPAYNEARNVGKVVAGLVSEGFKVLVVDDGSTDETSEVARIAGGKVIVLPFNLGVGGALRVGFQYATQLGFRAVIQVDADGQHLSSEIPKLIDSANASGAHLVLGSRFSSVDTLMEIGRAKRIVMSMLARSASRAARTTITDATSGFRLIQQPLLGQFSQVFPVNYLGDTYEALVSAGRSGYIIREIPTAMHERENGKSTASSVQAVKFTSKAIVVAILHIHSRLKAFQ